MVMPLDCSGVVKLPSATRRENGPLPRASSREPALLDDAALVEDDDQVGVDDGREAVRDDEGGAAGPGGIERPLDAGLGLGVQRAGGLVEQQDRRVLRAGRGRWPGAGARRRTAPGRARR